MTPKAITILFCFLIFTLKIQAQTGQPNEYELAPRVKVHVQLMTIDTGQNRKPIMQPLCNIQVSVSPERCGNTKVVLNGIGNIRYICREDTVVNITAFSPGRCACELFDSEGVQAKLGRNGYTEPVHLYLAEVATQAECNALRNEIDRSMELIDIFNHLTRYDIRGMLDLIDKEKRLQKALDASPNSKGIVLKLREIELARKAKITYINKKVYRLNTYGNELSELKEYGQYLDRDVRKAMIRYGKIKPNLASDGLWNAINKSRSFDNKSIGQQTEMLETEYSLAKLTGQESRAKDVAKLAAKLGIPLIGVLGLVKKHKELKDSNPGPPEDETETSSADSLLTNSAEEVIQDASGQKQSASNQPPTESMSPTKRITDNTRIPRTITTEKNKPIPGGNLAPPTPKGNVGPDLGRIKAIKHEFDEEFAGGKDKDDSTNEDENTGEDEAIDNVPNDDYEVGEEEKAEDSLNDDEQVDEEEKTGDSPNDDEQVDEEEPNDTPNNGEDGTGEEEETNDTPNDDYEVGEEEETEDSFTDGDGTGEEEDSGTGDGDGGGTGGGGGTRDFPKPGSCKSKIISLENNFLDLVKSGNKLDLNIGNTIKGNLPDTSDLDYKKFRIPQIAYKKMVNSHLTWGILLGGTVTELSADTIPPVDFYSINGQLLVEYVFGNKQCQRGLKLFPFTRVAVGAEALIDGSKFTYLDSAGYHRIPDGGVAGIEFNGTIDFGYRLKWNFVALDWRIGLTPTAYIEENSLQFRTPQFTSKFGLNFYLTRPKFE